MLNLISIQYLSSDSVPATSLRLTPSKAHGSIDPSAPEGGAGNSTLITPFLPSRNGLAPSHLPRPFSAAPSIPSPAPSPTPPAFNLCDGDTWSGILWPGAGRGGRGEAGEGHGRRRRPALGLLEAWTVAPRSLTPQPSYCRKYEYVASGGK